MLRPTPRGFTLIELMIVITIIGILIAILVPNWEIARYQAQLVACETNERNLANALETYNSPNFGGVYPPDQDHLSLLTPSFIGELPTCPTNGLVYTYTVSADFKNYTLNCPNGAHFLDLPNITQDFPEYSSTSGISLEPGP